MPRKKTEPFCDSGPDNAEHEIRKAYRQIIEACAVCSGIFHPLDHAPPKPPTSPLLPEEKSERDAPFLNEMIEIYIRSYQSYRKANRLAAERWARAAKHLAQALQHEAKIVYLEQNHQTLPYLAGAHDEEYGLFERSDTTADLLNSVATHVPPGLEKMPDQMKNYLSRARLHLKKRDTFTGNHELLQAERIQAAHEYGRTLECMTLGYEAELKTKSKAA
jgi:hypothetical protein